MGTLYVRNVDDKVMAELKAQAKEKGVSTSELARGILLSHTLQKEVGSIDDKYRNFVEQMMAIYQINLDEIKALIGRLNYIIENERGNDE